MQIEILDTTLRDGEQTSGVSFSASEKLALTRLLIEDLHVHRVEIASARVSDGELLSVSQVCRWAKEADCLDRIEVLGFLDRGESVRWIGKAGAKVMNLLAKGSEKHCLHQLKQTPAKHMAAIADEVKRAVKQGIRVNIYLEDWSNGIKTSPDYVFSLMDAISKLPIDRFMLPDTLGVLNPTETYQYISVMRDRYPDLHFDFHAHNDYDLATANTYSAVKAGVNGVHCTVNGLGERAGNATMSSVVAVIHDHIGINTGIDERTINKVSRVVSSFTGISVPPNQPVIGEAVFTQCAGVHADGDSKNKLYYNNLLPERFGRERECALGKTSGKANIRKNLESLGITLSNAEVQKLTQRIIELGDKKEIVTQSDIPFIVADILKHSALPNKVKVVNYALNISHGLRPTATVKLSIDGQEYQETAVGDGQYDAFVKAVRCIYTEKLNRKFPMLVNYAANIPPGGRTDALVHTTIAWEYNGHSFKTRGLDADQMEAAIQATVKMLNIVDTL